MSMYNAAAQANGMMTGHPGVQHHLQYAMAESYLPVGYDMQMYDQNVYHAPMNGSDMYRLPPMEPGRQIYEGEWTHGQDYWSADNMQRPDYPVPLPAGQQQQQLPPTDFYAPPLQVAPQGHAPQPPTTQDVHQAPVSNVGQGLPGDYYLEPVAQPVHHQHTHVESEKRHDNRMHEWARDGQQTPSGHVVFNERLFDGALGSATLPPLGGETGPRDEGLAGFDEAVAQVNDLAQW